MQTIDELIRRRAGDQRRGPGLRRADLDPRPGGDGPGRAGRRPGLAAAAGTVPRGPAARQRPRVRLLDGGGRAGRRGDGRGQPHPPGRRAGPRPLPHRVPAAGHRRRATARWSTGTTSVRPSRPSGSWSSTTRPATSLRPGRPRTATLLAGAPGRRPPRPGRGRRSPRTHSGTCCSPRAPRAPPRPASAARAGWPASDRPWPRCSSSPPTTSATSSMPLFHSNALMAGWAPALAAGATARPPRAVQRLPVPPRRPPLRRHLLQLRGQAALLHPGHPGAPRRRRQPAAAGVRQRGGRGRRGPVRRPVRLHRPGRLRLHRRRCLRAAHAGHPSRGARPGPARDHGRRSRHRRGVPAGRVRRATAGCSTPRRPSARWSTQTGGAGFEGYWRNAEAEAARVRNGWYWTGDLAYRDEDDFFYFGGRDFDWLRVDGENFAAAPVEEVLQRHPDVVLASVYAVPDTVVGDQVMATLLLAARAARSTRGVRRLPGRRAGHGDQVGAPLRAGHRRAPGDRHHQGPQAGAAGRGLAVPRTRCGGGRRRRRPYRLLTAGRRRCAGPGHGRR